jgi:hypothetical protein
MKNRTRRQITKIIISLFIQANLTTVSFSQNNDSIKIPGRFGGAVTVTSKGISTIPNLTLGKPAAIFDMVAGKGKLSFEPQFRFALEGKPWSFLFWWRYELLRTDKFHIKLGAHPAIAFRTVTVTNEGVTQEFIRAQRYFAGEAAPTYLISGNISLGMYYLYSRGLEDDITQNTNYLGLRFNFSNIRLSDQFFLRFTPQVYYLKMDQNDGFYFNSVLSLAKRNFPLTISSLINKTIQTEIPVGEDFLWNVSLTYTFSKNYRAL